MSRRAHCAVGALLAAGIAAVATPAVASEGYDNCTGFIDTVPAVITTQGTWCLRKKLTMSGPDNQAILIAVPNVTVDCNGRAMNTAKGIVVFAGVRADGAANATVRGCRILGFRQGVMLNEGGGHLVEDNLILGSRDRGIKATGSGNVIRRNRILDTGGATSQPKGIEAMGDILDNQVIGVVAEWDPAGAMGIDSRGIGDVVRGNVVRDAGSYIGINLTYPGSAAIGNHVYNGGAAGVAGIASNTGASCAGNSVYGYTEAVGCMHTSDNLHD